MTTDELERLCKVRRLARQSPEAGERQNAEAKLGELLQKHQVTETDLDRHEGQVAARAAPMNQGPPPGWGGVVIHVVPVSSFGQVFGFGFGFNVHFTNGPFGNSSTSASSTI